MTRYVRATRRQVRRWLAAAGWTAAEIEAFEASRQSLPAEPTDTGIAVIEFDYERALRAIIDALFGTAEAVLRQPGAGAAGGPNHTGANSSAILVEGGRDHLVGALAELDWALSDIGERDRRSIYKAVYRLVMGARMVAGYGETPFAGVLRALSQSQVEQAARMRKAKRRRGDERLDLRLAIVEQAAKEANTTNLGRLLHIVNGRLRERGLKEISRATLARDLKKLSTTASGEK